MNKLARFVSRIFGFSPICTVTYNGETHRFHNLEEARFYYRNVTAMDHTSHVVLCDNKWNSLYERQSVSTR